MFVALVGLWGCSRGPSAATLAERIKSLETKCSRIENDFRTASAARDQLRVQLTQSEDQVTKLQQVVKERDDLKVQVTLKTSERDQTTAQFEAFRRSIRELLGQADTTALRFPDNDTPIVTISARQTSRESNR
jgi:septal ring factor EnvC (AmiA/AmiB activator)